MLCIIIFAQHLCCVDQQLGRMGEKALGNQVFVGNSRPAVSVVIRPVEQPIPKVKSGIPQMIITLAFDKFDPCFHAGVLFFKNILISIQYIHVPGNDGSRIAPSCRAGPPLTQNIGNDMGHTTVFQLIGGDVLHPFIKKIVHVHVESSRWKKYLGVAGPPQSLITLGAIGRYIQEIAILPPLNIVLQLVQQFI